MTKEEKQRGLELQGYIDSIRDMTIKEIAVQHLKKYHLPKFLAGLLVKFSTPLLLAKDYELTELEKACDETQELLDKQIEATYKLDKEIAELKADNDARKFAMAMSEKVEKQLREENAEAKNLIEELASSLSVVGECDEEECELINKAQKFINKPIF